MEPKSRLKATHFVEQTVGCYSGNTYNSKPYGVEFMNTLINGKPHAGVTRTVAIFKIKFKNQPNA